MFTGLFIYCSCTASNINVSTLNAWRVLTVTSDYFKRVSSMEKNKELSHYLATAQTSLL